MRQTDRTIGGVEVVNVCLHKPDVKGNERASLDRLLNRINSSVVAEGRHPLPIFDEGREEMITRVYIRLRSRNPVPSRYEVWEDGERTKDIPIENVIGGPAFRSSHADHLQQMVDLIAHALLKQEEEPSLRVERLGIDRAFGILDRALNRRASSGGENSLSLFIGGIKSETLNDEITYNECGFESDCMSARLEPSLLA